MNDEVVEVFASGSDVASARYDVVGEVLREVTAEPAWLFVRVDCGGRGSGVITIHHGERIPLQLDSVTLGAPECGMRLVGHTVLAGEGIGVRVDLAMSDEGEATAHTGTLLLGVSEVSNGSERYLVRLPCFCMRPDLLSRR